ncbi:hypothetical protein [Nostoc sp. 'Peltigera membranacea cyanobiont' 232]|uniref:hypothetical protein n=1 Tax=Nostoc sp. 'Peltigera membranacea cyanobiont' 232 TaxID=2014531 RepID=UPI000B950C2E|nr:hypothetical protein [Nostoc sp. 'Peltigera membranacea cyanobiont' 232]OYD99865.1 hypothetical protein CDG79_38455 [Nostoc sp. 'Peltigera membranacea cyanobiont' 232]
MTKHDTWVKLKPGNPYESILKLFPGGRIPVRDPFPMERVKTTDGEQLALWIIDLERLSSIQSSAIAKLIAHSSGADAIEVAVGVGGFAMKHEWVDSMECGDEGIQRQKELADFFETAPQPPSARAYTEFYNSQRDRWIEGDEVPPPINSIEDVDPRLRTPELEQHFKMREVETAIVNGNYSVLDVLTGRAMVDSLNIIDPENSYSLVGYDDEFDEDEIYE